ncbi:hypothetical protein [Chryseobacterium candidae]|uniref:DUF4433 domain-containing protein n=1 Tax=Chryseobacterium candidae TaxID=1978493 RepID=A0ABY2R8Z7_9FLAO|nr:hypothetical protein [Chryseobacterium candidae]THV61981.1 hypothetical protein EK417_07185 [Chryseobacterium candidae]
MRLNNHELYDFFVEKRILALYHANTVGTSITYLQNGGLLSRGAVESKGLFQTPQPKSDYKDKQVNVWNDVFLDTADLHTAFSRENYYGPILFELDRELIKDENFEIWITKNNPMYWDVNSTMEERYFQNVDELKKLWHTIDRQRKMITIRNNDSPILFNYVRKVFVDDPQHSIKIDNEDVILFNSAKNEIIKNLPDNHILKGKFIPRPDCVKWCKCRKDYKADYNVEDLKRLFINSKI